MPRSDGEQGQSRGDVLVLLHPPQHSTTLWPASLRDSKWEWRGEGLWGVFQGEPQGWGWQTCHPGGPKYKLCPNDQGSIRRGLPGSAPTFDSSVSNSFIPVLFQIFSDKGQEIHFRAQNKSTTHYKRFYIAGLCWIVPSPSSLSLKDHGTNRWRTALLRC